MQKKGLGTGEAAFVIIIAALFSRMKFGAHKFLYYVLGASPLLQLVVWQFYSNVFTIYAKLFTALSFEKYHSLAFCFPFQFFCSTASFWTINTN